MSTNTTAPPTPLDYSYGLAFPGNDWTGWTEIQPALSLDTLDVKRADTTDADRVTHVEWQPQHSVVGLAFERRTEGDWLMRTGPGLLSLVGVTDDTFEPMRAYLMGFRYRPVAPAITCGVHAFRDVNGQSTVRVDVVSEAGHHDFQASAILFNRYVGRSDLVATANKLWQDHGLVHLPDGFPTPSDLAAVSADALAVVAAYVDGLAGFSLGARTVVEASSGDISLGVDGDRVWIDIPTGPAWLDLEQMRELRRTIRRLELDAEICLVAAGLSTCERLDG